MTSSTTPPSPARRLSWRFGSSLLSIGLLAGLATAAPVAAQDAAPEMCNGLEATHVVNDLSDPDAATNGDDVIVINATEIDLFEVIEAGDLPIYLALDGDDTICVRGTGFTYVFAGAGDDTVIVEGETTEQLFVWAGAGNDTVNVTGMSIGSIEGGDGDDVLTGGSGYDEINGGAGNDIIRGGGESDRLQGGSGDDEIYGEAGRDRISGNDGNDKLYGGYGDDRIDGGDGDDEIYGSLGNDDLTGRMGRDTIYGGPGNDQLAATFNWMNPHVRAGEADVAGSRLFGGEGDDQLWGSNRWDRMQTL